MKKLEPSPSGFRSWMPPEELQCIWMTAGVLTYKLCNRRFDCEHCLLHQALSADDLAAEPLGPARNPALAKSGPAH
jgi:hypothetical protein